MKSRYLVLVLLVLTLVLVVGTGYLWGVPRVLEVSPGDGEEYRSAGTPLRMTFSRPMQAKGKSTILLINASSN